MTGAERVRRDVRGWQWPTAAECERVRTPKRDQLEAHAYAFFDSARELAAIVCRECDLGGLDMARQPVHVAVSRFLERARKAHAWTPPPEEDADGGAPAS